MIRQIFRKARTGLELGLVALLASTQASCQDAAKTNKKIVYESHPSISDKTVLYDTSNSDYKRIFEKNLSTGKITEIPLDYMAIYSHPEKINKILYAIKQERRGGSTNLVKIENGKETSIAKGYFLELNKTLDGTQRLVASRGIDEDLKNEQKDGIYLIDPKSGNVDYILDSIGNNPQVYDNKLHTDFQGKVYEQDLAKQSKPAEIKKLGYLGNVEQVIPISNGKYKGDILAMIQDKQNPKNYDIWRYSKTGPAYKVTSSGGIKSSFDVSYSEPDKSYEIVCTSANGKIRSYEMK